MLRLDRPSGSVEAGTPLTLAEYLALPEDTRSEIVDGVLRPMIRPSTVHRQIQRRIANALEDLCPADLTVAEEEVVILSTDPPGARIPNVVVFRDRADPTGRRNHTPVADVVLAVEVVSEGTQTADRYEKPAEYARHGIPAFWRVELEPAIVVWTYGLIDGVYQNYGRFGVGARVKDPALSWIDIEVNDLIGKYFAPGA